MAVSNPSESELKLLRVLWREGRLSARELHNAALEDTNWSFSATRKTLERMEAKGLIAVEPVHGVKTYTAVSGKLDVMARLIKDFAAKILDADGPLPAAAFTGSRLIDEDEVEKLEELLERLSDEEGETS